MTTKAEDFIKSRHENSEKHEKCQGKEDRGKRRGRRKQRRRRRVQEREGGEKERRQKIHKTKAVVDDSKSCEYKLCFFFHLICTHSVGITQKNICRLRITHSQRH